MKSVEIQENECVDILTKNQLRIIQKRKGFRFSLDAVLLANFCQLKDGDKIIDLGAGNAVIPLIIVSQAKNIHITGIEIISNIAQMAERSVKLNNLESQISIINNDFKKFKEIFKPQSFDVIICNPPYHPVGTGNINPDHTQAIARHEIACTLEDVVKASTYLLKDHGRLFLIFKPQRIFELFSLFEPHNLHIHKMRLVHPNINEKANSILVESIKKGKNSLEIMPPLIVNDANGKNTPELKQMYF